MFKNPRNSDSLQPGIFQMQVLTRVKLFEFFIPLGNVVECLSSRFTAVKI